MKKLSVIVNGISNNERFINNLFTEIGGEITTELKDNEVLFFDIEDENSTRLYKVLAKNIVSEFGKKILVRIINKNCDYFSKADKYEVWKMSMKRLLDDEFEINSDYLSRIEVVESKLEDFFSTSQSVSIEGFVNFRLKELEADLEDVVEECVQEYLLEREYVEFINMLKYFVSMQSSKYLAVEIIYGDNILIYGDGKNITDECLKEFYNEVNCIETNTDDFILNSLISTAPKKVTVKQKQRFLNDEIKKTLLGIFGDKIKITTE